MGDRGNEERQEERGHGEATKKRRLESTIVAPLASPRSVREDREEPAREDSAERGAGEAAPDHGPDGDGDNGDDEGLREAEAAKAAAEAKAAEEAKRPRVEVNVKRERRMFGALLGHLGAARQAVKRDEKLLETRKRVEQVALALTLPRY